MNWAPHAPIQGRLAWRQARPTRTVVLEQKGTLKGSTSIRLSRGLRCQELVHNNSVQEPSDSTLPVTRQRDRKMMGR